MVLSSKNNVNRLGHAMLFLRSWLAINEDKSRLDASIAKKNVKLVVKFLFIHFVLPIMLHYQIEFDDYRQHLMHVTVRPIFY